jgi:hypothetical protein
MPARDLCRTELPRVPTWMQNPCVVEVACHRETCTGRAALCYCKTLLW